MSLTATGVTKSFGTHQLLDDINLVIPRGQKVALIGRNGSGKSTLLRILAGLLPPDNGSVALTGTLTLLEQHETDLAGPVLEAITPAELCEAQARLGKAEARLTEPTPAALDAYAAAEEQFRQLGGYDFTARAHSVLSGLGLKPDQSAERLSGGEQRRVLFARLLLSTADVLLLDEPTNHLDVQAREWLEDWLRTSPATILFASHDRVFLDRLAERVLELERGALNDWPGNYTQAMELKATGLAATKRAWRAQERKKTQLREEAQVLASRARSADRFNRSRASGQALIIAKAKGENVSRTLAGRQKSLQRRLERMTTVDRPFEEDLTVDIPLPDVPTGAEEVLVASNVTITRGERVVLRDVNVHVQRGEKIAVVGRNGTGKSTLLQALTGVLPFQGEVTLGHGVTLFTAWQDRADLDGFTTVGEAVLAAQPRLRRQDLFHLLGRLGLPGDPGHLVRNLSGGQRSRLSLARLSVTRAQLLVLDEPTNDLDLQAITALEELLQDYPGTVLFSSHDRRLVERVASRCWRLAQDGALIME